MHCDIDITTTTAPYELLDDCTEIHIPVFTSFDMSMLGYHIVVSSCSRHGLTCIGSFSSKHQVLVHASVQLLVGVPSYQSKRVNVGPYEEQPKSMKCMYQSLLLAICMHTLVAQDGRLTSALTTITIIDPRKVHNETLPMPVVMPIATPLP